MTKSNITAPRPNLNPRALPVLALAGRAVLTFRNLETGSHFTAKIKQLHDRKDRKVKLPIYYINIALLGDGVARYRFAGTFFSDTKNYKLGKGINPNDQLARVFRWMLGAILNPEVLRGRVGLFHEGKCCCCGLPLTHPESVYTGMGPVCLKREEAKMKLENVDIASFFEPVTQI